MACWEVEMSVCPLFLEEAYVDNVNTGSRSISLMPKHLKGVF